MVAIPPPTLEVFYAPSCAPCRLELPTLATYAKVDGSHLRIILVNEIARSRVELGEVSPALAAAAVQARNSNARIALRSAGDADGILPFTRSLASNGAVCASWRGVLTLSRINNMLGACAKFNAPHSPRS